ncbi:MAG: B-box zinc finger protein [Candidatus Villigracilaceae bacterium]
MSEIHYCVNHPNRETILRCNRCEQYICVKCAVRTPTGYRCKTCVREQQKIFDNAGVKDYLIVFSLGGFLSFLGGLAILLVTTAVWGIFVFLLAPAVGVFIGNVLRRIIRGRHARALNWTLVVAMILGILPLLFTFGLGSMRIVFLGEMENLLNVIDMFTPLFWQLVYLIMAVPTAYAQFSGIRIAQ